MYTFTHLFIHIHRRYCLERRLDCDRRRRRLHAAKICCCKNHAPCYTIENSGRFKAMCFERRATRKSGHLERGPNERDTTKTVLRRAKETDEGLRSKWINIRPRNNNEETNTQGSRWEHFEISAF